MALIIMGVLMILGVAFIALINHTIKNTKNGNDRSMAYDLAEAGVRYVHSQMLTSEKGMDWRPTPTVLPIRVSDPDYAYLKMGNPADPTDHGGPDKQGPYSRLILNRGRALLRVRYAPSDPTIFSTAAVASQFQPGLARDYTIVESIGKTGFLNLNDPTQVSLQSGVAKDVVESKKVIGFITCGLIEHARFVHNKFHVSAPAQIGWPSNMGAAYNDNGGAPGPVTVPVIVGTTAAMFNPYNPNTGSPVPSGPEPVGGDMYFNSNLEINGQVIDNLNSMLGDKLHVNGSIIGADDAATLTVNLARQNGNAWQNNTFNLQNLSAISLNSNSPGFSTLQGAIMDLSSDGDSAGYVRGTPFEDSPSTLVVDPDSGINRYAQLTQLGGKLVNFGNSGRFGYGQGVYINNLADIQIPIDEQGREDVGAAESLVYDWLNPDNGQANSGWQGAFYVPI